MSSPTLADGGRPVTVGKTAALLTEYAPITVINTSITSTVWLASSSSVSPSSGVPLEPGTSYQWSSAGTLYAVVDPAATDTTVTLVLTGAGGDWSPSPVAIGAAVATQLVESGIPIRLDIDYLGTWSLAPGGAYIGGTFPTGKTFADYGSIFIYSPSSGPLALGYQWQIAATGNYVGRADEIGYNFQSPAFAPGMTLPVLGDQLHLSNPNASAQTIVIFGYSRQIATFPQGNGYSSWGASATITTPANATGDFIMPLTWDNPPQGPCYAYTQIIYPSGLTLPNMSLHIQVKDPNNNRVYDLIAVSQMTENGNNPSASWQGLVSLPAGPYQLNFHVGTTPPAGTNYTALVTLIPFYNS